MLELIVFAIDLLFLSKKMFPMSIPGVSQSSLPGERIQKKMVWGRCFVISPHPSPSPASVKVPFRGERYRKIHFLNDFHDFYEKQLNNGTKMITSCSIRRASYINPCSSIPYCGHFFQPVGILMSRFLCEFHGGVHNTSVGAQPQYGFAPAGTCDSMFVAFVSYCSKLYFQSAFRFLFFG